MSYLLTNPQQRTSWDSPWLDLAQSWSAQLGAKGGCTALAKKLSEENAAGWDVGDFKGVGSTNQEVSNNGE